MHAHLAHSPEPNWAHVWPWGADILLPALHLHQVGLPPFLLAQSNMDGSVILPSVGRRISLFD